MPFITDQQTIDDLHLFGRRGEDSIYGLFHRTATRHGAALLEEMFRYPLCDANAINQRSELFHYFSGIGGGFPFQSELFDIAEQYWSVTDERTRLSGEQPTPGRRLAGLVAEDNEYKTIYKGVVAVIKIVQDLAIFLKTIPGSSPYEREKRGILILLSEEGMLSLLKEGTKISYDRIVGYDSYLRFRHRDVVRRLLDCVYQLDVYFSVASVAVKRGFVFPRALPAGEQRIHLRGIYHPLVRQAIPNTLEITPANHILFLTGANMAGKSTLMKTMGIVLFLAHMGFPVPASHVEFSVLDGIYTTINLPDDLGMGVSHFYAEVQRIKKIAQQLHRGKRLLIIFDELFRGTNVKDAYEATVALTRAFARRRDSVLLLSTHIIEAGEVLARQEGGIDFIYLPTRMEGSRPVYTYRLEKGITADRHGMVIIGNEGIFELLKNGSPGVAGGVDAGGGPEGGKTAGGFTADQQTLDDLNITGKYKPGSIYSIFNGVHTEGAERLLDEMFRRPLSDADAINRRSSILLYLQDKNPAFPFTRPQLQSVEEYLHMGAPATRLAATASILRMRIMAAVVKDGLYEQVSVGVQAVMALIDMSRKWFVQLDEKQHSPIRSLLDDARAILDDSRLAGIGTRDGVVSDGVVSDGVASDGVVSDGVASPGCAVSPVVSPDGVVSDGVASPGCAVSPVVSPDGVASLSWQLIARYHHLFGTVLSHPLHRLCEILYELDLYITVSGVARQRGLTYAQALPKEDVFFRAVGLRHPAIGKGVGNTITMSRDSNLLFLTGANMAGKSTLMKSFGIAVYLAHMGFPVAAQEMVFSVRDGLYTSINVPDDLNQGHSHFYAETLRVKDAAIAISKGRQLVVIFDELFKGTNVKDAYDATLAVTSAFSEYRNCFFIISTHIIEVGEELKNEAGLQLAYLPTVLEGDVPRYTYQLQRGITSDRHGMRIIENEGILALI